MNYKEAVEFLRNWESQKSKDHDMSEWKKFSDAFPSWSSNYLQGNIDQHLTPSNNNPMLNGTWSFLKGFATKPSQQQTGTFPMEHSGQYRPNRDTYFQQRQQSPPTKPYNLANGGWSYTDPGGSTSTTDGMGRMSHTTADGRSYNLDSSKYIRESMGDQKYNEYVATMQQLSQRNTAPPAQTQTGPTAYQPAALRATHPAYSTTPVTTPAPQQAQGFLQQGQQPQGFAQPQASAGSGSGQQPTNANWSSANWSAPVGQHQPQNAAPPAQQTNPYMQVGYNPYMQR